jgi:hypothetical protein
MAMVWSDGGGTTTTGSSWNFVAHWGPASTTRTGTLFGLQYTTGSNGAPNGYLGFGQSNATITANTTTFSVNVNFLPVTATAALTGTIKPPAGFPAPALTLTQQFGNTSHPLWQATTQTVSATIPVITAGKSALFATTTSGGATVGFVHPALAATTNVSFDLPAPAVQIAPFDGAASITTSSPFEILAPAGVIHTVNISASGKAIYQVITTSTTFTIPSVPEVPLPGAQSFSWSVNGFGPATSVDDAASAAGLESVSTADFVGPRHFFTSSPSRAFTTQ